MTYNYKNKSTELLKCLNSSRKVKIKKGWSEEVGAGFIAEDIKHVEIAGKNKYNNIIIKISFNFGHIQDFEAKDLNLRETEELIKFIKLRKTEEIYNKLLKEIY